MTASTAPEFLLIAQVRSAISCLSMGVPFAFARLCRAGNSAAAFPPLSAWKSAVYWAAFGLAATFLARVSHFCVLASGAAPGGGMVDLLLRTGTACDAPNAHLNERNAVLDWRGGAENLFEG